MGLLGHGSLSVLHSLFVGSRLQLAWPSLSSKRKIPKVTNQGRDRMQRQGRGSHKTVVKAWSRVMVLPQEIHRTISLSYLMLKLKLKLYYFGHLIQRANSLEKTVMLGKIECRGEGKNRGRDGRMASSTQWTWVWAGFRRWWWTGKPEVLQSMGL